MTAYYATVSRQRRREEAEAHAAHTAQQQALAALPATATRKRKAAAKAVEKAAQEAGAASMARSMAKEEQGAAWGRQFRAMRRLGVKEMPRQYVMHPEGPDFPLATLAPDFEVGNAASLPQWKPRSRLTIAHTHPPRWQRGDNWAYCTCMATGATEIIKVPADATEEAIKAELDRLNKEK